VLRCKPYQVAEIKLPPGDRLVLLTDGMLERGAAALGLFSRLPPLSELHPEGTTPREAYTSSPASSSTSPARSYPAMRAF
jgi:hypothetical protein